MEITIDVLKMGYQGTFHLWKDDGTFLGLKFFLSQKREKPERPVNGCKKPVVGVWRKSL